MKTTSKQEQNMERTLNEIQEEVRDWANHNFGHREDWHPLMGAVEEIGELAHAFLKRAQGIRHSRAECDAMIRDALGDIMIYLFDFCDMQGISLSDAVEETWSRVKKRDWTKNLVDGSS
jgi:NTP pyrophosphatase (non-canonical NTP hydrolase)